MSEPIEDIDISVRDVRSKLHELPKGSQERNLLRMLSAGLRTSEIEAISDYSHRDIHQAVNELFPEKDVSPSDFRKLLSTAIMNASDRAGLTQFVLDH